MHSLKPLLTEPWLAGLKLKTKNFTILPQWLNEGISSADSTVACFRGYAECVEGAVEKGVIIGNGVYESGEIKNTPIMAKAYEMGKNV